MCGVGGTRGYMGVFGASPLDVFGCWGAARLLNICYFAVAFGGKSQRRSAAAASTAGRVNGIG